MPRFRRSGIWDDIDDRFREMERMMEDMLAGFREIPFDKLAPGEPIYYGVSVDVGPDGIPHVRKFGNVHAGRGGALEPGVREPFVSTQRDDEKGLLRITAEMPGVDKATVKVEATPEGLVLRASGPQRKYQKTIRLRDEIDPDSAQASYNNGILEVTVGIRGPERHPSRDVPVT